MHARYAEPRSGAATAFRQYFLGLILRAVDGVITTIAVAGRGVVAHRYPARTRQTPAAATRERAEKECIVRKRAIAAP